MTTLQFLSMLIGPIGGLLIGLIVYRQAMNDAARPLRQKTRK